ncbi:ABC transporter substrate-binding protein [Microbacterium sp. 22303]|uniref:ABC transporter substrate-binding protein n=1 Tax=Microbacterium sp. 22303 TaxID=3453905 RepID=UPI003F87D020
MGVSGPAAGIASANVRGLEAGADAVNAAGGIDGRQIEVVVADDGLDPAKATTLLQEQLDKGPIDLAIPGSVSNVGLAMIAALTREKIISTGQQATLADSEKYPYHFGMVVPNPLQVDAQIEQVIADVDPKKVAILNANDANGQAVGTAYEEGFKDKGIEVAHQEFGTTDVDMTAQLQSLQAENPDVLILQGYGAVAGYTLQSRTKLGWDIPTYGHADYGTTDLASMSGPADWVNVKVLTYFPMDPTSPRTVGFDDLMTALTADGGKIDQTIYQYALFWDIPWLAKAAWESADGDDSEAISASYLALDVTADADSPYAYLPQYKWSPTSHQFDVDPSVAMRIVSPGPLVDGVFTPEQ